MTPMRTAAALAAALLLTPTLTPAQPLGQFQWQLQPFCNVVTLTVTQIGSIYTLDGFDNQCAGTSPRAPLVGVAAPNPDGSIGFGLNIVTTPSGAAVHVRATIQLPLLHGSWSDSAGNNGTMVFNGSAAGIGPRPAAAGQTLPSLSVTGSGSFGGPLSAPSLSVSGSGAFGGTVSAGQVTAATGTLGALSAGSVVSTGAGILRRRALGGVHLDDRQRYIRRVAVRRVSRRDQRRNVRGNRGR